MYLKYATVAKAVAVSAMLLAFGSACVTPAAKVDHSVPLVAVSESSVK